MIFLKKYKQLKIFVGGLCYLTTSETTLHRRVIQIQPLCVVFSDSNQSA